VGAVWGEAEQVTRALIPLAALAFPLLYWRPVVGMVAWAVLGWWGIYEVVRWVP